MMEHATAGRVSDDRDELWSQYSLVRRTTEELARPLAIEDYGLQAAVDVSPPKWHLAHTSWFFETFVLIPNGNRPFNSAYARLFNSYYETVGPFFSRAMRGFLSRPTVKEIYQYRRAIDEQIERFIHTANSEHFEKVLPAIVLGLHHEQQHQELFLTDVQYNLSVNPLGPAYRPLNAMPRRPQRPAQWRRFDGGLVSVGFHGEGFSFDNEKPLHPEWLAPFLMQDRLITNGEYAAFIKDGGYETATLWLSDGWNRVQGQGWRAPLYWIEEDGAWRHYTLGGVKDLNEAAPVCHVSYYEADAFARWAGKRLVRESEWEIAADAAPGLSANLLSSAWLEPVPATELTEESGLSQMFGDVWEWTQSAYSSYPGYRPDSGALGEYNGKFMSGQYVLRGGSCVTPDGHIRPTYRNFFPPDARWQFSGIRLASDANE